MRNGGPKWDQTAVRIFVHCHSRGAVATLAMVVMAFNAPAFQLRAVRHLRLTLGSAFDHSHSGSSKYIFA
jgi:hypothetical protein